MATSWLVYRLTGSELQLGLVGFAGQIPILVLTPFAGVVVDRMNRHRILVITQVLSLVQSAALAALTFADLITVPQLLAFQLVQGTVVQTIVDEQLRGRVMSFYTMAFFGTVPIGSLLAGVTADAIGSAATVRLGGIVCVMAGLWFAVRLPSLRQLVRPIYVERGILPAPATDSGAKTL